MERLGPRRTGILFAINAPLAAFLAWLTLNEELTFLIIFAIVIGFLGIALAVVYGSPKTNIHDWEVTKPPLWLGVSAGLLAALGQAAGVLFLRPVMEQGADPLQTSLIRVVAAGVFLWAMLIFEKDKPKIWKIPPTKCELACCCKWFFWSKFWASFIFKSVRNRSGSKGFYVSGHKSCLNATVCLVSNKKNAGAWSMVRCYFSCF